MCPSFRSVVRILWRCSWAWARLVCAISSSRRKRRAPCIVFIDEIDAIGQSRATVGALGTNDEREQTLNQLLAEMDGFEPNQGVIIMGATNRPEILDRALLRPGRFDRQVQVGLPTEAGRAADSPYPLAGCAVER